MSVTLAQARKAVVAASAAAGEALSLGLVPAPYDKYVAAALGVAGAVGVYSMPNAAKPQAGLVEGP